MKDRISGTAKNIDEFAKEMKKLFPPEHFRVSVTVNYPATVRSDGSYTAYIEDKEGDNIRYGEK